MLTCIGQSLQFDTRLWLFAACNLHCNCSAPGIKHKTFRSRLPIRQHFCMFPSLCGPSTSVYTKNKLKKTT